MIVNIGELCFVLFRCCSLSEWLDAKRSGWFAIFSANGMYDARAVDSISAFRGFSQTYPRGAAAVECGSAAVAPSDAAERPPNSSFATIFPARTAYPARLRRGAEATKNAEDFRSFGSGTNKERSFKTSPLDYRHVVGSSPVMHCTTGDAPLRPAKRLHRTPSGCAAETHQG